MGRNYSKANHNERHTKLSDEKIIRLIREKDKELYVHIIKRYQDKLMRYANYLVKDENNAADIVQESLSKLL